VGRTLFNPGGSWGPVRRGTFTRNQVIMGFKAKARQGRRGGNLALVGSLKIRIMGGLGSSGGQPLAIWAGKLASG